MRLSNRKGTALYGFMYSLVGIIFILGIIAFVLEIYKFDIFGKKAWVLLAFPTILAVFLYMLGRPIFEYDSDGEALNFRNNHILFLFAGKNAKDEFPKYKLIKYNVVNALVFKRLFVYINSKKSHVLMLKYDISYLSNKEIKDLKFSLSRVIKANQDISQVDNTELD